MASSAVEFMAATIDVMTEDSREKHWWVSLRGKLGCGLWGRTLYSRRRYKIASIPLRRITLSSAKAGPVGRLAPRSSCET
jgi:hypothetical protein